METLAHETDTDPGLETPVIPERKPGEVEAYNRIKRRIHIVDIVISLVYWGVCSLVAARLVVGLGLDHGNRWLSLAATALLLLAGSTLVSLPLGYYSGYIVEQRFNLSNQTRKAWLIFQIKSWLVGAVLGAIIVGGLYSALWYAGSLWSVYVWIGVMLLSVGLAKLFPLVILPLFYPAKPLDRPALTERLTELAGGAGMTVTGIFDLALSKDTKKANAMLAGLGSSRRVYLSDTLLEAFDDDQIAVVFTHELGHHIRGHIWKLIGISAVVTSILVTLIHLTLNRFAGSAAESMENGWPGAVAAFAGVMLIATVYPLAIAPVTNAISRHFERQADRDALRLTDNPTAYRTAFEQLGKLNLDDPNPPRWEVIMFDDHPPLSERIAMAGVNRT